MAAKKGSIDPVHLIVSVLLILGGVFYAIGYGPWGLVVVAIGLLMEAMKQVMK